MSTICLLFRHIQIIYKYDTFFSYRRAIIASSSLIHFWINSILSLICWCLGWKCYCNILVVISHLIKLCVNIHWFSCTCWAWAENVEWLFYKHFCQRSISLRVYIGNHNIMILKIIINFKIFILFTPIYKLFFLSIIKVIIDWSFFWENMTYFSYFLIEFLATSIVSSTSKTPN